MDKKKIENSILTLKTLYIKANVTKRKIKMPDIVCDKLSDLYNLDNNTLTSAIKQKADKDRDNSSRILHLKSYIVNDILMIPLSNVNSLDLLYGNQHKTINTEVEDTTDDIDDEDECTVSKIDDSKADPLWWQEEVDECKKNTIVATRRNKDSHYPQLIIDDNIIRQYGYIRTNNVISDMIKNCRIYYSKDLDDYFFKSTNGKTVILTSFSSGKTIKKCALEKGIKDVDSINLNPVHLV